MLGSLMGGPKYSKELSVNTVENGWLVNYEVEKQSEAAKSIADLTQTMAHFMSQPRKQKIKMKEPTEFEFETPKEVEYEVEETGPVMTPQHFQSAIGDLPMVKKRYTKVFTFAQKSEMMAFLAGLLQDKVTENY